jgi:DNA-binding NarL/FixJ family response regulator
MAKPRILLADDHALLLEAFQRLLEPEFDIVGSVGDGAQLVDEAQRLAPDVVVTDVSMPRMGGLEAARRLRDCVPATRIVFLTVSQDRHLAAEAFRIGASAWVLKASTANELVDAVHAALEERRYLTPLIDGGNIDALPPPNVVSNPVELLTPREREVVQLLAEGRSMKQAAAALGITARTVAFHKYRAMKSLAIDTSAELVRFAVRHKLL